MERRAFKMQLFKGQLAEYKRRHDEIWPELKELLKEVGINEYSIFFDEETDSLFGVYQLEPNEAHSKLADHPVMKKWWAYMSDQMETNPDSSPVSVSLNEVFYLK